MQTALVPCQRRLRRPEKQDNDRTTGQARLYLEKIKRFIYGGMTKHGN